MDVSIGWSKEEDKIIYGGDAYTGIQNAAAQTANNVRDIGYSISGFVDCVKVIGGFAFLISAFVFAALGISKLMNDYQAADNKNSSVWQGKKARITDDNGEHFCGSCWKKVSRYDEVCAHCGATLHNKP